MLKTVERMWHYSRLLAVIMVYLTVAVGASRSSPGLQQVRYDFLIPIHTIGQWPSQVSSWPVHELTTHACR